MVSPDITPEAGVSGYADDNTQGPACAMAAGAATIYRNYFAPVRGVAGQTGDRQLDTLAHLGVALAAELSRPVGELCSMRNGYALCSESGLAAITDFLTNATDGLRDLLRGQLAIGLHRNIEVTDPTSNPRHRVSQAYCSALPVR